MLRKLCAVIILTFLAALFWPRFDTGMGEFSAGALIAPAQAQEGEGGGGGDAPDQPRLYTIPRDAPDSLIAQILEQADLAVFRGHSVELNIPGLSRTMSRLATDIYFAGNFGRNRSIVREVIRNGPDYFQSATMRREAAEDFERAAGSLSRRATRTRETGDRNAARADREDEASGANKGFVIFSRGDLIRNRYELRAQVDEKMAEDFRRLAELFRGNFPFNN